MPWWELRPDIENTLLTTGQGSGQERAVAALADDRSFAVLYLPSDREITVDLGQLAGPAVAARWYDPADGSSMDVWETPLQAAGSHRIRPELSTNSAGFGDWVLLLESQS
jgi:hypothetical protein